MCPFFESLTKHPPATLKERKMGTVKFDEIVAIEWYRSNSAAEELEANDWYWNGEIQSTGTVCLFKLSNELIAWTSERGERKQVNLQSDHSIQENIKDVRKNFSGNLNQSTQIMCIGNPEWEGELEIGESELFIANDGNGTGSEISLKKQKAAIKKHPNRLICVRRNVYKGDASEFSGNEVSEDLFWDKFEPIDDMERSAFIMEK
jgi:hypothetical protein